MNAKRLMSAALMLVILGSLMARANAAYEFYITIDGAKQGKFKGESTHPAHQNKLPGVGFWYEVVSPRDGATGMASGKRRHSAVTITKQWGAATPQLFQACVTNEVLKSVLFEFVRPSPQGQGTEYVYQTITLTNASISGLKYFTANQNSAPSPAAYGPATQEYEEVSFTFQSISIENKTAKTMATDEWSGKTGALGRSDMSTAPDSGLRPDILIPRNTPQPR